MSIFMTRFTFRDVKSDRADRRGGAAIISMHARDGERNGSPYAATLLLTSLAGVDDIDDAGIDGGKHHARDSHAARRR